VSWGNSWNASILPSTASGASIWRIAWSAPSTIDGGETGDGSAAHLRWFIMAEDCQDRGLGRLLMTEAMAFCDDVGFARVWLWTFAGLDAARRLYQDFGFSLCRELSAEQWGKAVDEQMFERLA
jgi:GNAT superfamily N-acetyltransferase